MPVNATVPPPTFPTFDPTRVIGDFVSWWTVNTFGLFPGLLASLFVFSVFLKTRSLSATLVAAVAATALVYRSWALLVVALALAGLIWGLWQRSGE